MISFGSVFLELVFGHVHTLPGPGEEVFTEEFAVSCGGAVTSASAAARAQRRALELVQHGERADYNAILADIIRRDARDSNRSVAPLRPADDAMTLDANYLRQTDTEILAKMKLGRA